MFCEKVVALRSRSEYLCGRLTIQDILLLQHGSHQSIIGAFLEDVDIKDAPYD